MNRLAILAVCVVVVGCGDSHRDMQLRRQERIDKYLAQSDSCRVAAFQAFDHMQGVIENAVQRAEVDSLHSRITRLAADSARCAEGCHTIDWSDTFPAPLWEKAALWTRLNGKWIKVSDDTTGGK